MKRLLPLILTIALLAGCADAPSHDDSLRAAGMALSNPAAQLPEVSTAVGDIDGDGVTDEVTFATLDPNSGAMELAVRYGADGEVRSLLLAGAPRAPEVDVVTARFTSVLREEVVVAFQTVNGHVEVQTFVAGPGRNLIAGAAVVAEDRPSMADGQRPALAVGNFDNDIRDEIAFVQEHTGGVMLHVLDATHTIVDGNVSIEIGEIARVPVPNAAVATAGFRQATIAAVDHDADGRHHIALAQRENNGTFGIRYFEARQYSYNLYSLETRLTQVAARTWGSASAISPYVEGEISLAAANYAGDPGDELAFLYRQADGVLRLRIINPATQSGVIQLHQSGSSWRDTLGAGTAAPWVGAYNADGDAYAEVGVYRHRKNGGRARLDSFDVSLQGGVASRTGSYSFGNDRIPFAKLGRRTHVATQAFWDLSIVPEPSAGSPLPAVPPPTYTGALDAQDGGAGSEHTIYLRLPTATHLEIGEASFDPALTACIDTVSWWHPSPGCEGATVVHTPEGCLDPADCRSSIGDATVGESLGGPFWLRPVAGNWTVQPYGDDTCDWEAGGVLTVDYQMVPNDFCHF